MARLFVVILGLLAVGCSAADDARSAVERIRYVRDDRTGLCFAMVNAGYKNAMMAHVPCEAVKDWLGR